MAYGPLVLFSLINRDEVWIKTLDSTFIFTFTCFRYGNGVLSFTTLLSGITTSFNTEFQLSQVRKY